MSIHSGEKHHLSGVSHSVFALVELWMSFYERILLESRSEKNLVFHHDLKVTTVLAASVDS